MPEATYVIHDVANLFPAMSDDEFAQLKADIAANGLREPIWLHPDGSLIDGRHRHRACVELGLEPESRTWSGEGSLVGFVVSLNLHRRHLNGSQKAVLGLKILPALREETKAAQGERNDLKDFPEIVPESSDDVGSEWARKRREQRDNEARERAAKAVGVSGRYIQDAKAVQDAAPDLLEKVEAGELTIPEAKKEIRQREKAEKVAELAEQEPAPLDAEGVFSVVYADPPWRYDFAEDQGRQIENHYPTMDLDAIKALEVPADDNAVLFLWATSPKLPEAFEVMSAWGFTYTTCMVWVKDKIGMGYYARQRHELLLIGKRGSLRTPDPEDRPDSVIEAGRGQHSAKPDVVYDLLERMYPFERRVELFARRERDGWAAWGNQA